MLIRKASASFKVEQTIKVGGKQDSKQTEGRKRGISICKVVGMERQVEETNKGRSRESLDRIHMYFVRVELPAPPLPLIVKISNLLSLSTMKS
jgi:hypothetical protein